MTFLSKMLENKVANLVKSRLNEFGAFEVYLPPVESVKNFESTGNLHIRFAIQFRHPCEKGLFKNEI